MRDSELRGFILEQATIIRVSTLDRRKNFVGE